MRSAPLPLLDLRKRRSHFVPRDRPAFEMVGDVAVHDKLPGLSSTSSNVSYIPGPSRMLSVDFPLGFCQRYPWMSRAVRRAHLAVELWA